MYVETEIDKQMMNTWTRAKTERVHQAHVCRDRNRQTNDEHLDKGKDRESASGPPGVKRLLGEIMSLLCAINTI